MSLESRSLQILEVEKNKTQKKRINRKKNQIISIFRFVLSKLKFSTLILHIEVCQITENNQTHSQISTQIQISNKKGLYTQLIRRIFSFFFYIFWIAFQKETNQNSEYTSTKYLIFFLCRPS